jgi:hypothetical protein
MPASLLFTGHMIDKPDRLKPRFPASLEKAAEARIARAIAPFAAGESEFNGLMGFASGGRGGDIIFHERCRAQGVVTSMILPFSPDLFTKTSVEIVPNDDWTKRFWHLWDFTPETRREIMNLPVSDDAYRACNTLLLERARVFGDVHLIALWDGEEGNGPGGTADLVAQACATNKPDIFSPEDLRAGM